MTRELDEKARAYASRMCEQYGDEEQIFSDSYNQYIDIAEEVRKDVEADYTEQMRQLNEEWKENLAIQRRMLEEKWISVKDRLPEEKWISVKDRLPEEKWISVKDRLPEEGQLIMFTYVSTGYRMYETIYYPEPYITDRMDFWKPITLIEE